MTQLKFIGTEKKQLEARADAIDKFLNEQYPNSYKPFVISHILDTGHRALAATTDEELDAAIEDIKQTDADIKKEGKIAIMDPDFKIDILTAARALCQNFGIFDILSYARCLFVF
jgi:hypothetical protein